MPPAAHAIIWIVSFAILGHEVVLHALFGRTAGKALLGLRVVLLEDGTKPGPVLAFRRWAVPAAAGVVGGVMCAIVLGVMPSDGSGPTFAAVGSWCLVQLSCLWGPDGRSWADRAAGTVVVDSRSLSRWLRGGRW